MDKILPTGKRFEFFDGKCAIKNCELPELASGFCNKHWRRLKKYGSPLWLSKPAASYRGLSADARFFPRVLKTPGCWTWQSGRDSDGYGLFMGEAGGQLHKRAHRFSWAFHNQQPIPKEMEVLHSCDNPSCVNPEHLQLGSAQQNQSDKWSRGRGFAHKGITHWSCKLTEDQVREIRASSEHQKVIAARYGLNQSSVWAIIHRKSWKHVE